MDINSKYEQIDSAAKIIKDVYANCDIVESEIYSSQGMIDKISSMNFEAEFNSVINDTLSKIRSMLQKIYQSYHNSKFLNNSAVCALLGSVCEGVAIPEDMKTSVDKLLNGEFEFEEACSDIDDEADSSEQNSDEQGCYFVSVENNEIMSGLNKWWEGSNNNS